MKFAALRRDVSFVNFYSEKDVHVCVEEFAVLRISITPVGVAESFAS